MAACRLSAFLLLGVCLGLASNLREEAKVLEGEASTSRSSSSQTCSAENAAHQTYAVADPMVSLEEAIRAMQNGTATRIRLESRHYCEIPYGEVMGVCNNADGNRWDIFLAGYGRGYGDATLPCSPDDTTNIYDLKQVLGVYLLTNGNHKIAVTVKQAEQRYHTETLATDTCSFTSGYGRNGEYCNLSDIDFSTETCKTHAAAGTCSDGVCH
uniref:Uncharacterized protein n=1 Tax=Lotharella oceanica TaxID=641309 RepID=A0A7S2X6V2_9EUKA|mmetsp:Transcript_15080/g.28705  ORF Transcript_15080/g.28705 Transcript_15080/m.28705 type:complete len:212 (+) Transcript_15080:22-657(+)